MPAESLVVPLSIPELMAQVPARSVPEGLLDHLEEDAHAFGDVDLESLRQLAALCIKQSLAGQWPELAYLRRLCKGLRHAARQQAQSDAVPSGVEPGSGTEQPSSSMTKSCIVASLLCHLVTAFNVSIVVTDTPGGVICSSCCAVALSGIQTACQQALRILVCLAVLWPGTG